MRIIEKRTAESGIADLVSPVGQAFRNGNLLVADTSCNKIVEFGLNDGGEYAYTGFAITTTCQQPEEAAKLLNYLLNDPEGTAIMGSERGIPLSKAAIETCEADGLLDPITLEANQKVLANCECALDPTFEDSRLKDSTGIYYDVMAGLSYGDYDTATAAQTLMDGVNDVLGSAA